MSKIEPGQVIRELFNLLTGLRQSQKDEADALTAVETALARVKARGDTNKDLVELLEGFAKLHSVRKAVTDHVMWSESFLIIEQGLSVVNTLVGTGMDVEHALHVAFAEAEETEPAAGDFPDLSPQFGTDNETLQANAQRNKA